MATPRSSGSMSLTSRPSIRIEPAVIASSPASILSSVDLPQPEGPTKTTNSPSATARSTDLITSTSPKRLRTPFSCSSAIGYSLATVSPSAGTVPPSIRNPAPPELNVASVAASSGLPSIVRAISSPRTVSAKVWRLLGAKA